MVRSSMRVARLYRLSICCFVLLVSLILGCATPRVEAPPPAAPPVIPPPSVAPPRVEAKVFPDFVAVIAQEGDTLSSLAAKYLNDPSKDWWIAEFNDTDSLKPGQELLIPLKPYGKGGLTSKGYQIVPVLSYHNFSRTEARKMVVTEASFEEQMKLLKDKGYRVITMDQLFDFLNFTGQIPQKSVVINIDDGWRSAYEIAFPILKKYGYPATLFIYTDLITGGEKTLSWELIQEMSNNGIDVECHTRTHRDLTKMEKKESFKDYFDAVGKELSDCAAIVKKRLNKDVKYLAYPYGNTNHLIIELAKKDGLRGAFTVKREGNPFFIHPYRLNRSMIYGEYNLEQFEKNLSVFTEESLK